MPPRTRQEETPEQILARQLSALNDSVSLITQLVASGVTSEDAIDTITRNYRHVEIMLAKENILNSGTDLSVYTNSVTTAKAYIVGLTP